MNPGQVPNAGQVQRPIIYPYQSQYSWHLFLTVENAAAAREFVAALLHQKRITDAGKSDDEVSASPFALNIGFTQDGLQALGVPPAYLRVFEEKARAFAEGPNVRAARRLADTGPSAAQGWQEPFQHRRIHIYLVAHADKSNALAPLIQMVQAKESGVRLSGLVIDGAHLTDTPDNRKVHFGFRDNVANPTIKDWPRPEWLTEPKRPKSEHEAGEFVLGYKRNSGYNPWLLVSPSPSSTPWLLPVAPIDPLFFWNGSFGVFRKMKQDVDAFEKHVARWAEYMVPPQSGLTVSERQAYVRAKICGRWDDGSVVRPGDYKAPGQLPADLDGFDFSDDRKGEGCPFGSHIRRMNPRSDPVVPKRARPLIRRGMPYGRPEDAERGLLGLFFCASLEDQFEHLLCEWGDSNPMGPPNRGTSKDGFTGAYGPPSKFDIPVPGGELNQLDDFRSFVTTRGTVYAFFPSLTGIHLISRATELAKKRAA